MTFAHRTHVLLDDERQELLRRKSAETGRSVGALVRDAIDLAFASEEEQARASSRRREDALASFLAAEPMPVEDWPSMEREIEAMYERDRHG